MIKHVVRMCAVFAAVIFMSNTVLALSAEARAGGSRSSGSRGSRSYSTPATNYSQPSQTRQQVAPSQAPFQQQAGGGFMRNMAGGIMGGMLGSMLFSSFAGAGTGTGGMGGGGIGLFEIVLIAGLGYLAYRFIKKRKAESALATNDQQVYREATAPFASAGHQSNEVATVQLDAGLSHIRQMDGGFDEDRFNDTVMDMFFKVQAGWMNRDLSPVAGLLTDEMKTLFQEDVDRLLRDNQVNRLENIAVRKVKIEDVWQESGQDYITASIVANLLDYTTDDTTGAIVSGSNTEPVKFEEQWTFTRPVGNNSWRLSGINQI